MTKDEINKIWRAVEKNIKNSLSPRELSNWEKVVDAYIVEINESGQLILDNDSVFSYLHVKDGGAFFPAIERSINEVTGTDYKVIVREFNQNKRNKEITDKYTYEHGIKGIKSFENYVVSPSNKMIVKACITVSEQYSGNWSPLFIHGKSGIGKTHLLQAIGRNSQLVNPSRKVKYINAYDFIQLVQKIGTSKSPSQGYEELKKEYNSFELLLIDDVQTLADKEKSKEILFNVFRHYDDNEKQIVIVSDTSPDELRGFEARLVTRFKSNLVLKLTPPDVITAREILINKIKYDNSLSRDDIDPQVIEFIASNFSSDVRSLEGALSSLTFWAISEDKEKIGYKDIPVIFSHLKTTKATLSIEKIIGEVARYYAISKEDIKSSKRSKKIVNARHISVYMCREMLNSTYVDIGQKLGGRDHSTIMSSHKKIKTLIKSDEALEKSIQDIKNNLSK
ncbi:MAG: chromosomal replication initiator protein DnaA [Mycoplasmataceae bacterium]|nr:chromosomal replication initiator protein DnaA [Mycoplasmataceae bacterium]